MGNEVAVDQLKTVMKVAAETGEAEISSVEAVEAATAAETSMTEASSAIVVATAVAATVEAAVVQAGDSSSPCLGGNFLKLTGCPHLNTQAC